MAVVRVLTWILFSRHPLMGGVLWTNQIPQKETRYGKTQTDMVRTTLGIHSAIVVATKPHHQSCIAGSNYACYRRRLRCRRCRLQMGGSAIRFAKSLAHRVCPSGTPTHRRLAIWHSDTYSTNGDDSCRHNSCATRAICHDNRPQIRNGNIFDISS